MKEAAVSFADDMLLQRPPRWISFLGTSGAGKTMLAKIIWELFKQNFHLTIHWDKSNRTQSDFNPWGQIVRWHGGYLNWGNAINNRMMKGNYDFLEDMRSYDFFVIDDIISEYEKHRALSAAKLYNIFDNRIGKWTVITCNADLEQIGNCLDPRIASRMIRGNSVVVDVDVQDFNLRPKRKD